jgi:hypothetical protein
MYLLVYKWFYLDIYVITRKKKEYIFFKTILFELGYILIQFATNVLNDRLTQEKQRMFYSCFAAICNFESRASLFFLRRNALRRADLDCGTSTN